MAFEVSSALLAYGDSNIFCKYDKLFWNSVLGSNEKKNISDGQTDFLDKWDAIRK